MSNNAKKSKNLLSGILIYGIGDFGSKLLVFLIVPLYTYYISKEDMGYYDLLITTINLITPLITMQISDAAYTWMIKGQDDNSIYIRSTLHVLLFNCFMASCCIIAINYVLYPFRFAWYFVMVLITGRALTSTQKILRGLKNQKLVAFSGILYTAIFLVLNVVQICVLKQGVEALFQSAFIANLLTIAAIFIIEKRLRVNLFKRPDFHVIKKLLKFSVPLVPNTLNWWIISSSDRYIIRFFIDAAANGIYAISYKFPTILQIILNLFNNSWQDVSVADNDRDTGKYYSNVFKTLFRMSFAVIWFLIPSTKLFIYITMSKTYHEAADYISFLYLGTVFQCFSSFYGVGYLRDKNTKQASLTSIYGAIVNAAVNILLIRYIGLFAASISTFMGFFVMWLIRERHNRHELGIRIDLKMFIPLFLITLALCVATCFTSAVIDVILFVAGLAGFAVLNYRVIKTVSMGALRKITHRA